MRPHVQYYLQYKGPIPEGYHIDHLCRRRSCVNPDHLEAVLPVENMRRSRQTKLTVERVREIKTRIAAGEIMTELAKEFGVRPGTVFSLNSGHSWKDVKIEATA